MRLNVTLFVIAVTCLQCGTSLSWLRSFSGQDLVSSVRTSVRNLPPSLPLHSIGSGGSMGILPPSPPTSSMSMLGGSGGEGQAMFVSLIRTANQTMHQLQPTAAVARKLQSKLSHTIIDWWKAFTDGRSGLLLMIMPVLVAQLRILRTTVPFVAERLAQYVNPPLALLAALAVLRPWGAWNGAVYLRDALWASAAVGGAFMLCDSYVAGASWRALEAGADSYALVTGAGSGLGRDLARRLHRSGYNLVLVDDAASPLQQLSEELASTYNLPTAAEEVGFKWTAEKAAEYFPNVVGGVKLLQRAGNATVSRLRAEPRVRELAQAVQRTVQSARERLITAAAALEQQQVRNANSTIQAGRSDAHGAATSRRNITSALPNGVPGSSPSTSLSFVRSLAGYIFPSPASDANVKTLEHTGTTVTTSASASGAGNRNHIAAAAKTIEPKPAADAVRGEQRPAGEVHMLVTDFRDPNAPWNVMRALQELNIHDKVEVLVHAAEQRPPSAALSEQSLSAARDTLLANAHFPLLLTKLLLSGMLHRAGAPKRGQHENISGDSRSQARAHGSDTVADHGHGGCRVLFVSSVNPSAPSPMTSIFSASKALVTSFAQSLRREVLPQGVLVTVANVGLLRQLPPVDHGRDKPRISPADSLSSMPGEGESSSAPEEAERPGSTAEGDWDRRDVSWDPQREEVAVVADPWLRSIPFRTLSAKQAGREVFAALCSGRDAVTPGTVNKLYLHGVARVLPAPALAALHQMVWSAPPRLPRFPRPPTLTLPDLRRKVRLPALYVTAPAQSFPVLEASRAHILRAQQQARTWSGASLGKRIARLKSKIAQSLSYNRKWEAAS